jgi:hypothetical protein
MGSGVSRPLQYSHSLFGHRSGRSPHWGAARPLPLLHILHRSSPPLLNSHLSLLCPLPAHSLGNHRPIVKVGHGHHLLRTRLERRAQMLHHTGCQFSRPVTDLEIYRLGRIDFCGISKPRSRATIKASTLSARSPDQACRAHGRQYRSRVRQPGPHKAL